ncbi:MAG TPA: hypothetical protein DIU07_00845 [Rhodobacteraceae bacterium]|nr:hypothetical protein [Paracoccaceae bacterium]
MDRKTGKIKFFDKGKNWGFIINDEDSSEVYFHGNQVSPDSGPLADGSAVEFVIGEHKGRTQAQNVVAERSGGAEDDSKPLAFHGPKGSHLGQWAFIPMQDFTAASGNDYKSVLPKLAEMTLDDESDWSFLQHEGEDNFGILHSYLTYTFVRLWNEGKLAFAEDQKGKWAAFNTGLVDTLYKPIYALFSENPYGNSPYKFVAFCVPGIDFHGKRLIGLFDPLPERAEYFSDPRDVFLDSTKSVFPQHDHIIEDGIRRGRFPIDFLRRNKPFEFEWQDPSAMTSDDLTCFLGNLADAVKSDDQCYRGIIARVDDAVRIAIERVKWNFKTAIPQYYPKFDLMSLLLPLGLVKDDVVDLALVVQRQSNGTYSGNTIIPLSWAYKNARLVCRPDSDWLTNKVKPSEDEVQ